MQATVQWRALAPETALRSWDEIIRELPYYSIGQTYSWGQYKSESGWQVVRVVAERGGVPCLAGQCMYRPFKFGTGLVWMPGGPVGDYSLLGELLRFLSDRLPSKMLYVRIRPHVPATDSLRSVFLSQAFVPSRRALSSDKTMWLELNRSPEELRAAMSASWRHNLRRSAKYGLKISRWINPQPDEMYRIYQVMESYKNLDEQFSLPQLQGIIRNFGDRLMVFRCENSEGQTLAFRGCAIEDKMGWDLFAAASPAARKVYASHALLWALVNSCRENGVRNYDLMGIDPVYNPGVYNFKHGTGAGEMHMLGEWEWSKPWILAPVANFAMQVRGGSF